MQAGTIKYHKVGPRWVPRPGRKVNVAHFLEGMRPRQDKSA